MRIDDDVLEAANQEFGWPYLEWSQMGWPEDRVRAFVSFVVERSIDYEAAKRALAIQPRGSALSAEAELLAGAIRIAHAALGIGGDDE